MTLRELFGGKVRALRQAKRLTQEQLGQQSGLHYTYVGAVERAETNLSMDNIDKLAGGLGVEPAELFRFSSGDAAVSDRDKLLLELMELVSDRDEKALAHILRIVTEAMEMGER